MQYCSILLHYPLIVMILSINDRGNAAYFTGLVQMEKLFKTEQAIIKFLQKYIKDKEQRLNILKDTIDDYLREYEKASTNVEEYLSNPVNAYVLIKHLTADWQKIKKLITKNVDDTALENFIELENSFHFPNEEDLDGAAIAMGRLQNTYKLGIAQIAKNVFNAEDCYEIGKRLFFHTNYGGSIPWLLEAATRSQKVRNKSASLKIKIMEYLSMSYHWQGNTSEALKINKDLLEYIPTHRKALENQVYLEVSSDVEVHQVVEIKDSDITNDPDADNTVHAVLKRYKMLCRGEVSISENMRKDLRCRYVDNNIPFLLLAPLKQEIILTLPRIVIYHDVISDEEITVIKRTALPRFLRSEVSQRSARISETSWLYDHEHELWRTLNKRIGLMTHLNANFSEAYQVLNYGIGGYYAPHFDFLEYNYLGLGDRIATVLFYNTTALSINKHVSFLRDECFQNCQQISDVEIGGGTVFPFLNVSATPKKGTALVWYNLLPNGEPDWRTYHAACPILKGSKWIINKWIHERGQELLKPCTLNNQYVNE